MEEMKEEANCLEVSGDYTEELADVVEEGNENNEANEVTLKPHFSKKRKSKSANLKSQ